MSDLAIALISVAVGFGLSLLYQEARDFFARRRLKKALKAELRANVHMLYQKRDVVRKTLGYLEAGEFLPGKHTRFLTDVYSAHYAAVSPHLSEKERISLHQIYEYLRRIDLTMHAFTDDLVDSLGTERVDPYVQFYHTMLTDILSLVDTTLSVAKKHLDGNPQDVLYLDIDLEKMDRIQFTRDKSAPSGPETPLK